MRCCRTGQESCANNSKLGDNWLKVSDNHRLLVTADGKPFFWRGDTACGTKATRPQSGTIHMARQLDGVVQQLCVPECLREGKTAWLAMVESGRLWSVSGVLATAADGRRCRKSLCTKAPRAGFEPATYGLEVRTGFVQGINTKRLRRIHIRGGARPNSWCRRRVD